MNNFTGEFSIRERQHKDGTWYSIVIVQDGKMIWSENTKIKRLTSFDAWQDGAELAKDICQQNSIAIVWQ